MSEQLTPERRVNVGLIQWSKRPKPVPNHRARLILWLPIDWTRGPQVWDRVIGIDASGTVRPTYWGKTSHVPLYGWNYLRDPFDVESAELWEPTHWRPHRDALPRF